MRWKIQETECGGQKLIIIQDQGDNTPTVLNFPYDVTGYDFSGTVKFPSPISLSLDDGITVGEIISFTGSINSNVLTVSAIASGTIYIGMPISGAGIAPNTFITEFSTGTGGTGTYSINKGQMVVSTTIVTSKVLMQLSSEQTQTVPPGQYPFDLWVISPDVNPINSEVLSGFFEINLALTIIS